MELSYVSTRVETWSFAIERTLNEPREGERERVSGGKESGIVNLINWSTTN